MPRGVYKRKPIEFDPKKVRDISEVVYRERLEAQNRPGVIKRLTKKHGEAWFRATAGAYDSLTRSYFRALGIK